MSTETNKAAMQRLVEKGLNQKNIDELNHYYSPNLTDHALPPNLPSGLAGRTMFISGFFTAFPDVHLHIDDIFAEGDRVVTRWSAHARHTGDLMGIPPTGKQVTMTGIAIDRFKDGKSVEHWEIMDQLGLMQQLGVIPS